MSSNQQNPVYKVGDKVLVKVTLDSQRVLDELARRIRKSPDPEARLEEIFRILRQKLDKKLKKKKSQKYLRM